MDLYELFLHFVVFLLFLSCVRPIYIYIYLIALKGSSHICIYIYICGGDDCPPADHFDVFCNIGHGGISMCLGLSDSPDFCFCSFVLYIYIYIYMYLATVVI